MSLKGFTLGIHNYYKIASDVAADFHDIMHRIYGKYQTLRKRNIIVQRGERNNVIEKLYGTYKKPLDKCCGVTLYPIQHIHFHVPTQIDPLVTPYTPKGRERIHQNQKVVTTLEIEQLQRGHFGKRSVEYIDNRISKFVGQYGKCGVTDTRLTVGQAHCHHIKPLSLGGTDRYHNLVFVHKEVHKLIHCQNIEMVEQATASWTKKMRSKLNKLRTEVGLSTIKDADMTNKTTMERRMRGNSHVRCEAGEKVEITSKPYLSLYYPDSRREEVINYTMQRYGLEKTAQMVTFNTLAAKGSVKDVARALGKTELGERITRLIPTGPKVTLQSSLDEVSELNALYSQNGEVREIIDFARQLEGLNRSTGVHAAGVLLSAWPLNEIVPLSRKDPKDSTTPLVCGYEHKWLEDNLGLIKYDFLGLANLSVHREALAFVARTQGEELLLEQIPVDPTPDPVLSERREKAFAMLSRGDAIAVFQLESAKMREYLKQLKPTCIEDIMAMVALYRPGPMDSIPEFVACKHGRKKVTYLDPRLSEWLAESYGVIVYQDQVLQIANNLAGFSWGKVNKFRKALSKKKMDEVEGYKGDFIQGCVHNGMKAADAEKLFTLVLPFGGYGFNKAHAASYGVVAYYTAYLKANYPAEYMAAALTADAGDSKQVAVFIAEAHKMGVKVLGPDVNTSELGFSVEEGNIRFGLLAIKGIGEGPITEILRARADGGPFTSLVDFCVRVTVGKGVIENLIKAGALDSIEGEGKRHRLLASVETAITYGKRERQAREREVFSLFKDLASAPAALVFSLSEATEISRKQLLDWEKELIGVYISPHPLTYLAHLFDGRVTHTTTELLEKGAEVGKGTVTLGGVITNIRAFSTKKGDMMCSFTLEDAQGGMMVTVFPRDYETFKAYIEEDKVVLLIGETQYREQRDEVNVLCNKIEPLQAVEKEMNRQRHLIWFTLHSWGGDEVAISDAKIKVQDLHACLRRADRGHDLYEIEVCNGEWCARLTPHENTIDFTPQIHQQVANILGEENITVQPM
ncbi:hypothetical protein KSC_001130 [Ktedonobacter sp. SOSP1-52]|nr:hypothetical protein KSC_001130 [Ktedonobacter sp. SOSP1-52]